MREAICTVAAVAGPADRRGTNPAKEREPSTSSRRLTSLKQEDLLLLGKENRGESSYNHSLRGMGPISRPV